MTRARLLLIVLLMAPGDVFAQRKGSSGSSSVRSSSSGKSYSSGSKSSSSSGKSSSSSSKSSSSGKSYSSGSSSRPSGSSSSSSRPSSSGSTSRPSSSGSSSRPGGSSYDSAAGAAARRSESKSIFERRTSPNVAPGSGGSTPRSSTAGKRYSEGNVAPSGPVFTPGSQPRTTYTDSGGRTQTVNPSDRRVDQIRRELNEDRWYTRTQRSRNVFVNVAPPLGYPMVTYSDPYSNIFWWWLLSSSLDNRAYWAYHHRYDMDPLRYRDLMARDQALEARVRELEAQQVKRDPTHTPTGVDSDLMYTDDYVASAVNPTIVDPDPPARRSGGGFGGTCFTCFLIAGIGAFLIWFIFIKRWGGKEPAQGRKVPS